jgi:CheY-like chemotaxis protein
MIRVLVVDDRADFRQAFAALLEGQPYRGWGFEKGG